MRLGFLHIFQPKQQSKIDRMQNQLRTQLSSIKPDTNKIFTNVKQCLFFSLIFFVLENTAILHKKCYLY